MSTIIDQNRFQEITWKEAGKLIKPLCPSLHKIINKLSPDASFKIYRISYPYGMKIIKDDKLHFPGEDYEEIPIDDSNAPDFLKNNLKRRVFPFAIMLSNKAEIYKKMSNRLISRFVLKPGSFFGLWGQLDESSADYTKWGWTLISGARSVYMLPKISSAAGHRKIQTQYGISSHVPKTWPEHHDVFVELIRSPDFPEKWDSEILFFSDKWFETATKDSAWQEFYLYMFQEGWKESHYWRENTEFELLWESFLDVLIEKNFKPNLYLNCIVKQLIVAGMGVVPLFTVADDKNALGPFSAIQEIYLDDYKVEQFPIIMVPHHFSLDDEYPSYYSVQFPNLLQSVPVPLTIPSVLSALPEIKKLLFEFKSLAIAKNVQESTPIARFFNRTEIKYFHSREEKMNDIHSTDEFPKLDDRFKKFSTNNKKYYPQKLSFPGGSQFINGCIMFNKNK
jgi:hypothetical protein